MKLRHLNSVEKVYLYNYIPYSFFSGFLAPQYYSYHYFPIYSQTAHGPVVDVTKGFTKQIIKTQIHYNLHYINIKIHKSNV